MFRNGQVWVETVIYTLIGLSLIGIVLALVTPQIKDYRDRALIEQSLDSLNSFDNKISEVVDAPGNRRNVIFEIKKGNFYLDTLQDKIKFVLDESESKYSEVGVPVQIGRASITTIESGDKYEVSIEIEYPYNLTFEGRDIADEIKFSSAPIPYQFYIENHGNYNGPLELNIIENS